MDHEAGLVEDGLELGQGPDPLPLDDRGLFILAQDVVEDEDEGVRR